MHPYLIAPPRLGRTGPRPKPVAERFSQYVSRTEICWNWTGPKDVRGYGYLNVGSYADDSMVHVYAHRIAYELASGEPIPDDMRVCHDCPDGDDPSCVRNDTPGWHEINGILRRQFGHLWLGTQQENVQDSVVKGRAARAFGETHYRAKLTADDVANIRSRWAANGISHKHSGLTKQALAREYRVDSSTIRRILSRESRARE